MIVFQPAWDRPCGIAKCGARVDRHSNPVMRADILTSDETPAHFHPEVGMPDQVKTVARPWRRFVRLSVRGLIVLVLVIGAGLGWMVRQAHIQREAVAAIRKRRRCRLL